MAKTPVLVGPDGRPLRKEVLRTEQAGPTTTGVRQIWSEHPAAGLTPGRLAAILRAAEDGDPSSYLALAEDMEERDLHYLGVMGTRKRQVSQLQITVDAASDAAEDVAAADLVRDWIERDTLQDELVDVLDAVGKGYSVVEIIWDTSEGQWIPERLEWRDPRWFRFDRTDGQKLRLLGEHGEELELTPYKYLLHVHKAKSGLPVRGGLARAAAWCYLFKNYDVKDWVIFAEAYGQPLRVGKYGADASDTDKATLLRAVREIGADRAAIIPDSMLVEFIEAKTAGTSIDLYERLANFCDTQISKAVLGQTTTTDAISGGHAVSKEHNEVREDIERADAKQLAATLNRDLVRPLVAFNMGAKAQYPRIRIGRPESIELKDMLSALSILVPMGLKVGMSTVRDRLGIPDPDEDEELLMPPAAAPAPGGPGEEDDPDADPDADPDDEDDEEEDDDEADARAARIAAARAEDLAGGLGDDALDALIDTLEREAAAPSDALIEQIRALVGEATDLDYIRDRLLPALLSGLSPDDLAGVLGAAMAAADLAGRDDA